MPQTDGTSRTGGRAPGPRRTLAALLIGAAFFTLPASASRAQTAQDATPAEDPSDIVLGLVAEAMGFLLQGQQTRALVPLEQAEALAAADEALPAMVRRFPDLARAQLAYRQEDWTALDRYASGFESGMIENGLTDHPYRVEATILRAIAAFRLQGAEPALPLIRSALDESRATPEDEAAEELAFYYLALAASQTGSADAVGIRQAFLESWQGHGWVGLAETQFIRYPNLALGLDPQAWDAREMTEDEVLDMTDAGLDLAEAGYMDAARSLLTAANDETFAADYPLLTDHYPNLGFARFHYLREDWSEMQRFAASVASALDREGTTDHPYRIEATILQGVALFENGRTGEAEVLLRGAMNDSDGDPEIDDLHELAHYFLARAATSNESPDASALREGFMARFTGDYLVTNAQALMLLYLSLNAAIRAGEEPEQLITQSEQILTLADQLDGVDPTYRSFYRGNHGQLLYKARRYEDARVFFEERRDFLIGMDNIAGDFAVNAMRLGNALARTVGVDAAREQMLTDLALVEQAGSAPDWALSDLTVQIGFTHRWQEDEPAAQRYFRDAYSILRKERRVTDERVKRYAALIDPDDPGMAGYAFAAELGAIDDSAYALKSGGEDTIRMFLEGNYAALERLLDAYRLQGRDGTPAYLVNLATYHAMMGEYDDSQSSLTEARRKARTTTNSAIPANAAVFDLIDIIAKVWGTQHLADKADGAIARLEARVDSLPANQRSLYLVLRALSKYQSGQTEGLKSDLIRWIEAQPESRDTPPDVLEQWSYALASEMIYTELGPEEGDAWNARMLAEIAMPGAAPLSLVHDTLELTQVAMSPTQFSSSLALSRIGGIASVILDQLPRNHNIVAATQFNVANVFVARGKHAEALEWMQRATDSWRANPYHRKDTLAYLVAQQSNLMMRIDQVDLAATLAREAYDMIDPHESRSDLAAGVIMTYAYAVRARNTSPEMGGNILKTHVEDPAFMRRLLPRDASLIHISYADMLANYAKIDAVLEQLDLAEAALPDNNFDWRSDRAQIALTRAIAVYWAENFGAAWAEVTRSNDLKAAYLSDTIRDGDGEALDAVDMHNRAAWEAIIGWDYAQSLPPAAPQ